MDQTETAAIQKQAEAGDWQAQWEINLIRGTGIEITPGLSKLALRPASPRIKRGVPREMAMVDSRLIDVFRKLASGMLPWPLFLWGPSGSGKTRAALALSDFVEDAAYFVPDGLCAIEKCDDRENRWRGIGEAGLVVLDELGERSSISDFAYVTTKHLLDLRDERPGREAIYVANTSPGELQRLYDDRIASRVLCGTIFKLEGKDRRATR